jgi:hypothetical protein
LKFRGLKKDKKKLLQNVGSGNKASKEIKLNFNQFYFSSIESLISGGWYSLGLMNRMAFETEFYDKRTFDKDFEKLYKKRIE